MSRFRDTAHLLSASVQEWLPEDHLARFIVETVEQLDFSELERQYGGRGMAAFPPTMLLAPLFYGYATDEFSSRWCFGSSRPTPTRIATRSRPLASGSCRS